MERRSGPRRCLWIRLRSSTAITDPWRGEPPSQLLGEPTFSVSELAQEIREIFGEAFVSLWVAGEVGRARTSPRGHLYFELVEKGGGDQIIGKLDAVIWRTDHLRIRRLLRSSHQEITDGLEIRCRARIDFYPPAGRLQLVVRDVDPFFTLGHLERRRRQTLADLAASGLLERNKAIALPAVPLRLGLVTSRGSAAFHDFLSGISESGYGFEVLLRHAAMQGREAEREIVMALRHLGSQPLDALVLIRGGGSRSDLVAFDSKAIAEAVARCPLPVVTGLGHEIDQSIADLVAHTALKTPTKVAEFLVERVYRADSTLAALQEALLQGSRQRLRHAWETMGRAERLLPISRLRLQAADKRLASVTRSMVRVCRQQLASSRRRAAEIAARLATSSPRRIDHCRVDRLRLGHRLIDRAAGRLREAQAILEGKSRLCHELAPERILERGYSITRDVEGNLVRHPNQVATGDAIETRLEGGVLSSRVEES